MPTLNKTNANPQLTHRNTVREYNISFSNKLAKKIARKDISKERNKNTLISDYHLTLKPKSFKESLGEIELVNYINIKGYQ